MLSVVKMLLKGKVGGHVLNSHGNYNVDHGKSWKNHGIVFLNFYGNPVNWTHVSVINKTRLVFVKHKCPQCTCKLLLNF